MTICAVIIAGGRGERFWPKSRKSIPKQFLNLASKRKTMIQLTFDRLVPFVGCENIYVVTNEDYKDLVEEQLSQISIENILYEPMGRNTAPCIALAAAVISRKYDDSIMLILPSDHIVFDDNMFIDTLNKAVSIAEKDTNLVTIGIMPTYPETGYGYIRFRESEELVYEVESFIEKPDYETAKEYLDMGRYLWNSGIFVWKISSIVVNFEKYLPNIYKGLLEIQKCVRTINFDTTLRRCYKNFESISIDYGIMEKAENIYVIPGNFGWNDVGSFVALDDISMKDGYGNVKDGDIIMINTQNSIILGNNKLIATVGLNEIVIVDTDDAILICSKDSVQDVKKIVEKLSVNNRHELI